MICKSKRATQIANHHRVLPPNMRDLASCFNERAVKVSDASCSGSSGSSSSAPSVQSSINCFYISRLSTLMELLIRVTWTKTPSGGPALSISVDDDDGSDDRVRKAFALNTHALGKKGSQTYTSGKSVYGLYWDISSAKHDSGPEPIEDFYVVAIADSEYALVLGDMFEEFINEFEYTIPTAEFSMVSRRERVVGQTLYTTNARFHSSGRDHEITIRCKGDAWDAKESELYVSVDRKKVVHVRRLNWNFRGNQTIFVDGAPVDMMWDVYDWWFTGSSGHAVFLFRTRSALESRLWLEEAAVHKEQSMPGFSLLIQAFKNP